MDELGSLPAEAILTKPEKPAPTIEELAVSVRTERNKRIAATDYLVMPDYPHANPAGDGVAVAFASEGDGCSGIVRQRVRACRKRICRGTHTERYRGGAAYEKGEARKKSSLPSSGRELLFRSLNSYVTIRPEKRQTL